MTNHRTNYKNYLDGKQNYVSSYEILKHGDAYIELIYEGEFESKSEMQKREGQEIRNTNCVNKYITGRTYQEWRNDNKETIAEQLHDYYEQNKPKIAEQKKQKFNCECGGHFTQVNKARYLKSKKHNLFLQNQKLNIIPV